jgi:hypothetical protein
MDMRDNRKYHLDAHDGYSRITMTSDYLEKIRGMSTYLRKQGFVGNVRSIDADDVIRIEFSFEKGVM